MTDDKIAKDTARDPEREALGRLRGGIRAAAKKAVRKVVKKAGQKKAAKKVTAAPGKTTARSTRSVKKADKTAPAGTEAPASRAAAARTSAAKAGAAPARTATARASGGAASTPAAPAAAPQDPGPSIERSRPPAPIHPGAAMDSVQEHVGGLGSMLALWGPLIIVGFLVLVFRGGDEGESTVATGAGNPSQSPEAATAGMARGPGPSGAAAGIRRCVRHADFDGGPAGLRRPRARCGDAAGSTRDGSIRPPPDPIAIREFAACPPARAGPRTPPTNGCGPPKAEQARSEAMAAMHAGAVGAMRGTLLLVSGSEQPCLVEAGVAGPAGGHCVVAPPVAAAGGGVRRVRRGA